MLIQPRMLPHRRPILATVISPKPLPLCATPSGPARTTFASVLRARAWGGSTDHVTFVVPGALVRRSCTVKLGGTSLARAVAASLVLASVATAGGFVLSRGGGDDDPPATPRSHAPARPATHPVAAATSGSAGVSASAIRVPKPAPLA